MIAVLSRALKIRLLLLAQSALLAVTGCDRVPDVVIRVSGIPKDTRALKASLWQLRSDSEGKLEGIIGTPIPAFAYATPEAETDHASSPFRFGLKIPDEDGLLYSIDVAAFQTFGSSHCLLSTTQQAIADTAELRRGPINLPQEFALGFQPAPNAQILLRDPNIDGLCLSDLDADTRPIISGLQLGLDQSRRMGENATLVLSLTGWNFRPRATLVITRSEGTGQPESMELKSQLLITSSAQLSISGTAAMYALDLAGKQVSFVVRNEDGEESVPYITQIML